MKIARILLLVLSLAPWLEAQNITGSISGTVTDPTGLPIADAGVTLTRTSTMAQREMRSDIRGDFVFGALTPGEYSITVKQSGFKTVEKSSIMLTASETLSVGQLTLQLGDVSEKLTVEAQGTAVQVASSERACDRSSLSLTPLPSTYLLTGPSSRELTRLSR